MRQIETSLIFGVLGKIIEGRNMQLELAAFAELAKAGSETDEVWTCN